VRPLVFVELEVPSQGNPTSDDDDEDDSDLDSPEKVLETDAPFERQAMDEKCGGDASKTNPSLVPPVDLNLSCVENVFSV
jgi:hypothetical protein